jgi:hypothetical protein
VTSNPRRTREGLGQFNSKQQAFLPFVLSHYMQAGIEELDR